MQHAEFLDTRGEAPMRACAQALVDALGSEGPIFTYSRYERTVIHQLAARFPDLAEQLNRLAERLFDLLPLTKAHYYHPAMRGSYSLKAVLPTVAPELSYDGLGDVQDGVGAQLAYESLIDANTPAQQRRSLSDQLREYCRLDTLAMVRLVRFFETE
jgi:predicted RecB family nuclease